MGRLLFYLFYVSSRLLAFLPLRVLFVLSDINFALIYHVVGYRKRTVRENLKNSFPDKTDKALSGIERRFYRHFCDLFVEVNCSLFASSRRAKKMVSFRNIELVNSFYEQGKSVIVTGAHYGNWELFNLIGLYVKHTVIGAYKPISNKYFENFLNSSRGRFGALPVPMHDVARMALKMSHSGTPFFLGLISDQTPAYGDIRYWTTFLNQDTPIFLGTERIAMKTNQPVLFCRMMKVARGRYEVELEVLTENPKETRPHEITEMHVRALERLIQEKPEYWLWSHRRWKHKRKTQLNP